MNKKLSALDLRARIQGLIRTLGLLRNQTPCGKPVSVSMAHALMFLRLNASPMSQSNIQKTLQLDKSSVARLCMSLEKEAFVTQRQSETDGRSRVVTLTKKGERLADSLLAASQNRFNEILNQIPKSHKKAVFDSIEILTSAIQRANSLGEIESIEGLNSAKKINKKETKK
jgi:DNA-binding MarR family transcriptional regulator